MRSLFASVLFAGACSSAYADQPTTFVGPMPPPGAPQIAIATANAKVRAPYDVEVVREDGDTTPTYAMKDRFYVQGNAGERYTIRVTNPTAHRVEAVVTVDGLDVIDGENGDLHKRGYIVPAYGEVRIEGFRTSQQNVATFRFSSVNNSYAGQKGKARNVGVIAAAIFEEEITPEQQVIVGERERMPPPPPPYDYRNDLSGGDRPTTSDHTPSPPRPAPYHKAPAKEDVATRAPTVAPSAQGGGNAGAPAPRAHYEKDRGGDDEVGGESGYYNPTPAPAPKTNRPGLGTEFGEQRYSATTFTTFKRNGMRPIAVAELRYNDVPGLMALGIPVAPLPDSGEIMTRETADPFPGDHYARPPGR